jgi:hypothetical protein
MMVVNVMEIEVLTSIDTLHSCYSDRSADRRRSNGRFVQSRHATVNMSEVAVATGWWK